MTDRALRSLLRYQQYKLNEAGLCVSLIVLGLLAGMALAEGLLHALPTAFRARVERERYIVERHIMQAEFCEKDEDPLIGWHNIPGKQGVFKNKEFVTHLRFNQLGMRGPEVPAISDQRRRRIVVLGDSLTVGWGVEEEETFVHRMCVLRPDWEVLNLGVSGYGTRAERGLLERVGPRLHPNDVLVVFYPNDAEESQVILPFPPRFDWMVVPTGWRRLYLAELWKEFENRPWTQKTSLPYYCVTSSKAIEAFERSLIGIERWCSLQDAGFHVAYFPYKDELQETGLTGYRKVLLEFCQSQGIHCMDLTPVLQRPENLVPAYFGLDEHLTPAGHTLVSHALVDQLDEADHSGHGVGTESRHS